MYRNMEKMHKRVPSTLSKVVYSDDFAVPAWLAARFVDDLGMIKEPLNGLSRVVSTRALLGLFFLSSSSVIAFVAGLNAFRIPSKEFFKESNSSWVTRSLLLLLALISFANHCNMSVRFQIERTGAITHFDSIQTKEWVSNDLRNFQ